MSNALGALPKAQLLERLRELVRRGNAVEAELIAHLAEVDARQLYLEEGYPSMFAYCQPGKPVDPNIETHAQLQELRELMRRQIPDGDVGKILSKAIANLLKEVRKQKFAETCTPRSPRSKGETSRHIPAAVRGAVWERDGGCCTYVSANGRRCSAREFIEFDHAEAWTWTHSHSIEGIASRCRAHNQLCARHDFGARHMARFDRTGSKSGSIVEPGAARGASGRKRRSQSHDLRWLGQRSDAEPEAPRLGIRGEAAGLRCGERSCVPNQRHLGRPARIGRGIIRSGREDCNELC
jgi:hypothetical protein